MGNKATRNMDDYINDYEEAAQDYSELGPLWAELVFPDDFEALKALYGGRGANIDDYDNDHSDSVSKVR